MKNSIDTIGNRNRDHPACSAVPQPTAPPCAPYTAGRTPLNERLVPNKGATHNKQAEFEPTIPVNKWFQPIP